MTTYAKCRDYGEGDCFPYIHKCPEYLDDQELYEYCNETLYECWQPDSLDNEEFNMVIMHKGSPVLVRGIHFDFIDVED